MQWRLQGSPPKQAEQPNTHDHHSTHNTNIDHHQQHPQRNSTHSTHSAAEGRTSRWQAAKGWGGISIPQDRSPIVWGAILPNLPFCRPTYSTHHLATNVQSWLVSDFSVVGCSADQPTRCSSYLTNQPGLGWLVTQSTDPLVGHTTRLHREPTYCWSCPVSHLGRRDNPESSAS